MHCTPWEAAQHTPWAAVHSDLLSGEAHGLGACAEERASRGALRALFRCACFHPHATRRPGPARASGTAPLPNLDGKRACEKRGPMCHME